MGCVQHVEHIVFEHLDDVGQFVGGAVVDSSLYEVFVLILKIHGVWFYEVIGRVSLLRGSVAEHTPTLRRKPLRPF